MGSHGLQSVGLWLDGHIVREFRGDAIMSEPLAEMKKQDRLVSLDAYRGFVMLAMVSGGFAFRRWLTATLNWSLTTRLPCPQFGTRLPISSGTWSGRAVRFGI